MNVRSRSVCQSSFSGENRSSLLNLPSLALRVWLAVVFLTASAWGQQSTTKPAEYQSGGNRHAQSAVRVPFVPGPLGPDGKVHPVAPTAIPRFANEVETPEVELARSL